MLIDGEELQTGGIATVVNNAASPASSTNADTETEKKSCKKRDLSEYNLDGLSCPICMEPWKSQGDHQVCCLPCGHIYGMSCINRWIQHRGGYSAKCPQCNEKITLKDVRKLYASPVIVVDENSEKRANLLDIQDSLLKELRHLKEWRDQIESIRILVESSVINFSKNEAVVKEREIVERVLESFRERNSNTSSEKYILQMIQKLHEMAVESARIFDMDCYYQTQIFARRISGMGGTHMLKKINLTDPNQNEDIKLPSNTKAVKDLHVSPCGRLVLLASLGKKLSIISMGCNKVVISYSLPGPAWSCSWDPNSSHYMYAGLQNGMLLVFDMRQTVHPVQSINGLSSRPIHTIHSFEHKPTLCHGASLLTASAIGPCVWNTSGAKERPFLLPELDYQGMCTSLAYSPSSDDIVATYRPKIQMSKETGSSQPHLPAVLGQEALSSQIHVKRVAGSFYQKLGSASTHVGNFFWAKSAIINVENCLPMFAYGDDVTCGLTLRDLPSLIVSHILKPHQHPIRDVKYTHSKGSSLLGCISDDKLQLFSAKFL
ncbi:E3 ubiquitin-protein ligase RFWD3 [Camellia lanceoleosa]|uniref:E3 ubiquitin-protein ligase RFWD3 n=1 Tax=Camellia lanceoleosa TaxID=1840588 RepID=A0ACC0H2W0_9ERIC|nr:E3 ubiquitin-protein ligase RFWD3 [Camellia lanceoleosa]